MVVDVGNDIFGYGTGIFLFQGFAAAQDKIRQDLYDIVGAQRIVYGGAGADHQEQAVQVLLECDQIPHGADWPGVAEDHLGVFSAGGAVKVDPEEFAVLYGAVNVRFIAVYKNDILFPEGILFSVNFQIAFPLFGIDQEKAVVVVSLYEVFLCAEVVAHAQRIKEGLLCGFAGGVEVHGGFFGTADIYGAHGNPFLSCGKICGNRLISV